ncbi:hypothetical protein MRX96_008289 [Rhipicephalus microplus]
MKAELSGEIVGGSARRFGFSRGFCVVELAEAAAPPAVAPRSLAWAGRCFIPKSESRGSAFSRDRKASSGASPEIELLPSLPVEETHLPGIAFVAETEMMRVLSPPRGVLPDTTPLSGAKLFGVYRGPSRRALSFGGGCLLAVPGLCCMVCAPGSSPAAIDPCTFLGAKTTNEVDVRLLVWRC